MRELGSSLPCSCIDSNTGRGILKPSVWTGVISPTQPVFLTNTYSVMSKPQDRTVSQRPDGQWANKRNDASKAASLHPTQKDAYDQAKSNLQNQGGGEITVQGKDHKFREKNTIKPGNDPRNIPG